MLRNKLTGLDFEVCTNAIFLTLTASFANLTILYTVQSSNSSKKWAKIIFFGTVNNSVNHTFYIFLLGVLTVNSIRA